MSEAVKKNRFAGVWQIVQFNWPFYVVGLCVLLGAVLFLAVVPLPRVIVPFLWLGMFAAAWWYFASLVVSWWVYDASTVTSAGWLDALLQERPSSWAVLHAGLDQATPALADLWGSPNAVLDFFDAEEMTERSILRARRLANNEFPSTPAPHDDLPLGNDSLDLTVIIFAAHELRHESARRALFGELYRVVKPGGSVLVVEHERDFANFLAFGPGFLHFLPASTWTEVPTSVGFHQARRTKNTPFVTAYRWDRR